MEKKYKKIRKCTPTVLAVAKITQKQQKTPSTPTFEWEAHYENIWLLFMKEMHENESETLYLVPRQIWHLILL